MLFSQAAEMLKQLHVRHLSVVWQNCYYLPTACCTWREATVKWEMLILPKHTAPSIILCIKWSNSLLSICTRAVRQSSLVAPMSRKWGGTFFFLKKTPQYSLFMAIICKAMFLWINPKEAVSLAQYSFHMTQNSICFSFGAHYKFLAITEYSQDPFHCSVQLLSDSTQAIAFPSHLTCYWNAWGGSYFSHQFQPTQQQ